MGDFRKFCAWYVATVLMMCITRKVLGGVGLMPIDEIARIAFVALIVATTGVAIGGQRIERP